MAMSSLKKKEIGKPEEKKPEATPFTM